MDSNQIDTTFLIADLAGFTALTEAHGDITSAIKYLNFVIPAKAGIQIDSWMPEQVRHDGLGYLVARLICQLRVLSRGMSR